MKKALAMTLGALLVAGSAAPAFAASQVDFSGYYRTIFGNDWNLNRGTKETKYNDSYFVNRLHLDFGFHATDEVSVYWALRAPNDQRWGDPNSSMAATTYHAYGEVKQDWGTVSIGRLTDAYAYLGLASVGYNPGGIDDVFTDWGLFDLPNTAYDGIRFANRWDSGFQLVAQFNRLNTGQSWGWDGVSLGTVTLGDEESADLFILQPSFHWDTGAASLAMLYYHDQINGMAPYTKSLDPADPFNTQNQASYRAFLFNPAFAQSFGDFGAHFEGMFGRGKDKESGDKSNGYGFYLDVDYNYGPGSVLLAGWWTAGTGKDDTKDKALLHNVLGAGMGSAFQPLLLAYGSTGYGREVLPDGNSAVAAANANSSAKNSGLTNNHWALALGGAHAFTDDLTLKYTVGYLGLNKVDEGAKKEVGWEADLGLQVNLLDNLEFRTTFGYLAAGKALDDRSDPDNIVKAKDAYSWYNTLVFNF